MSLIVAEQGSCETGNHICSEDGKVDERDLTQKQLAWLEASKTIGPGPMTKTERERLEKLYADMEPREQQDLHRFIQEKYGKEPSDQDSQEDTADSEDPIKRMQERMWHRPSNALKKAFSTATTALPPKP